MMTQAAPQRAALLLLTAAQRVRARQLGDVEGHEFHGNQWTEGAGVGKVHVDANVSPEHAKAFNDSINKLPSSLFNKDIGELRNTNFQLVKDLKDYGHTHGAGEVLGVHDHGSIMIKAGEKQESVLYHEVGHRSGDHLSKRESFQSAFKADTQKRPTGQLKYYASDIREAIAQSYSYHLGGRDENHVAFQKAFPKTHEAVGKIVSKYILRGAAAKASPLHAAADAHLPATTSVITRAFAAGRTAIDKPALKAATSERAALSALDAVPGAVQAALLKSLPAVLLKCLAAGGAAGVKLLPKLKAASDIRMLKPADTKIAFNVANPNAVAWAKAHAAELAKNLSDTTRDDIKDAVSSALETGDIASSYDDILDAVGDEDRADLIARTETMTAANEGQRQSWNQAVDDGLLTGDESVTWIATDGCCDECDDLDGSTRDINGEYDGEGGDGPPLHPNCRCTEGITQ